MSVRIHCPLLVAHLTYTYSAVLRDAQEQRAARMEAERKLVEFQEQLKKVLLPPLACFTT